MKQFSFRITFGDTDPFGIAYFTAFLDFCKKALDEWLRDMGILPGDFYRNRDKGWGFSITETSCRYFKAVKYDEIIVVKVKLKEIVQKDILFLFEISDGLEEKCAEALIKLRCVDKNFKSIPIPEEIRLILQKTCGF